MEAKYYISVGRVSYITDTPYYVRLKHHNGEWNSLDLTMSEKKFQTPTKALIHANELAKSYKCEIIGSLAREKQ